MSSANDEATRDAHAKVEEVFGKVMELTGEARARALDAECASDGALRTRVERLLAAHDGAERLIPTPPAEGFSSGVLARESDPLIGEAVGMFRVERMIGVGGMGAVYEATQDSPHRRVALKVMRAGMIAKGAAQRFRTEAEALGALEHPNIARIYEAGVALTKVGRTPYFAMELIVGRSLLEHAKERGLGAREKIALFAGVCDAVEHAHRRGIIHRDLKPGNILVTDDGVAKVLDFGVARLTASDLPVTTLHTEAGQLLGTLQYMSPEQAGGDPLLVDTRSDVYALGVVLYELLSGVLPYDVSTATLLQAAQIIREQDAKGLGEVVPALKGDVETIVRKAIEKRPEMRYQSAAELAADLRRFLSHEPIAARPPSATYYLRKFVRRNKALSIGAGATVLALVLGVVGTSIGLKRAVDARQQADQNAAESALNAAKSEINAYVASIQAAAASLRSGDLATTRARLDGANPAFRAWEWNYVHAQCDQSVRTLDAGMGNFVSGFSLSRDETRLAAVADNAVRIYDVKSGQLLRARTNEGLGDPLGQIAWNPDGTRLALTIPYQPRLVILDAETLEILASVQTGKREFLSIEWSPDGTRLAMGIGHWAAKTPEDLVCTIWRTSDWSLERTLPGLPWRPGPIRWSPDGRMLLVGTAQGTVVFDTRDWSGREAPRDTPSDTNDRDLAWSPDAERFVAAQSDRLTIHDARTLDVIFSMPILHGKAGAVRFTADGTSLVVATNEALDVLDSRTGAMRRRLRGFGGSVFQLAVSRSSGMFWTGDSRGGVKQWSLDSIGDMLEVQARDNATPTPDFSLVAHTCPIIGQDGAGPMSIRDGRTGQVLREFHLGDTVDGGSEVRFSPNAQYLIRAQNGPYLSVLDLGSGERWERRLNTGQSTGAVACTGDSRFVLQNSRTHLRCFTLPSLEPSEAWGSHERPYRENQNHWGLAVSPDGQTVVIDVDGGDLLILRQSEPRERQVHVFDMSFCELSYSPDGRWFVAQSRDGHLALLETSSWRIVSRYGPLPMPAPDLCFDPTGTRLFASQLDGTVRILGLFTLPDSPDPRLIEVASLRAGDYWMMRVFMSDDGTRLMSATAWPENRYFIWDARGEAAIFSGLTGGK